MKNIFLPRKIKERETKLEKELIERRKKIDNFISKIAYEKSITLYLQCGGIIISPIIITKENFIEQFMDKDMDVKWK